VRLFLLGEQLYLSSHDWIAPIWIGGATHQDSHASSASSGSPPRGYQLVRRVFAAGASSDEENEKAQRSDGDGLALWIRPHVSCSGCSSDRYCGKNFNYFPPSHRKSEVAAAGKDQGPRAYVEVWPSLPHQVRAVDLLSPCRRDAAPQSFVDNGGGRPQAPGIENSNPSSTLAPTFSTVEELHFSTWRDDDPARKLLTRGRGGACCVEMSIPDPAAAPKGGEAPRSKAVLVGIQHVKTPSQHRAKTNATANSSAFIDNHYLSRFYAFEPFPPFRIVSQSGYFCLGFATDGSPLNEATRWRHLVLGEHFEDCPRIHFVSGMAIKVDDPSSLVVAYGINDCVSAVTEIPVRAAQRLLTLGGPVASSVAYA
jgi:hypothetical protein